MTMANKERYKQIELSLRKMCFQYMDKMYLKLQELIGTTMPTQIKMAFFGSLLCYVVWWNDNEMKSDKYVKALVDSIVQSISNDP